MIRIQPHLYRRRPPKFGTICQGPNRMRYESGAPLPGFGRPGVSGGPRESLADRAPLNFGTYTAYDFLEVPY